MYIRTTRAYCWCDDTPSAERPTAPATDNPAPIRWARTPWPSPAGPLVAVRLVLGVVQVGLRANGRLRWVSAGKVLTERQARRWAANGF